MLDLEELEYFVAFAECGTLSKVAEKYHISTPSMTRSMQNLEKCFGVRLFERQKNKMSLNETGQFALVYAKKLLEEADRTLMQVRAFDERNHTIVVKSCAPAPLWESLKKIAARHPNMTISSEICQNEEVLKFMEKDACDLAILPFSREMTGWKKKEYMKEQLFVCLPKGHVLAEYKEIHWSDLNGFNFLLRSELGFWDTLCREKMPASKFLVQTDDAIFDELVNASTLPCFTTDYIADRESVYADRLILPIADEDANICFFLYEKTGLL